ncbi:LLM class flavin-dependent oxidoreductase [Actinopolymorpha pittospori]|uniref:Alkanesulfonate monooxygenase SsuD/methylene tetrahydromethanopterin reductase-like flavin-dependent oxidoreductase (Luciferase family) n=1 Tax=Actinopolymorpha pittospori TaxID=648752 RepID=A0A927MWB1_9ACTN|nr:LLM class flavin-dependent oxidoreductase [Actinopolymorpha pittospori]MBE1607439.1 alkanesulfonate monooxygenase SsuD/methylene tetrahydromethanopterin reductase-like flavin-dependent oxidoreductase (luciferase family) [Actinopolymorpha pittospori]
MAASSVPHLAVALEGAGWHPAAWREPEARSDELFSPAYWTDLVLEAQSAALDFVTFEDSFSVATSQATTPVTATSLPDSDMPVRPDRVAGRLDAVLLAARVAPRTRGIGIVPTATVTHTEPFHLSKAIATLDYVTSGRAGWRVRVSASEREAAEFGRRDLHEPTNDLFDEAADYVDVVRRLWDSWEDDAEIRDTATGRFVDRDKLHYIDFEGRWFSVKGPSITSRPPQGQPLVTALAHGSVGYRLAARAADIVFATPNDVERAGGIVAEVREEQAAAGREGEGLHVFADLVVFLDTDPARAADRRARLDQLAGAPVSFDAPVFTGTPETLADLLLEYHRAGLTGFRLRPGTIPHDLEAITRGLVPELRRRGAFRHDYDAPTLRGLLGLARPANRYAVASGSRTSR